MKKNYSTRIIEALFRKPQTRKLIEHLWRNPREDAESVKALARFFARR